MTERRPLAKGPRRKHATDDADKPARHASGDDIGFYVAATRRRVL